MTETCAVRWPAAVGLNVIMSVQLPPALNKPGQSFVCEKSPGLNPVKLIEVTFKAAESKFFIVTANGPLLCPTVTEPKSTDCGAKLTVVPLPLNVTVCGLPGALSINHSVAERLPLACGVKRRVTWQL